MKRFIYNIWKFQRNFPNYQLTTILAFQFLSHFYSLKILIIVFIEVLFFIESSRVLENFLGRKFIKNTRYLSLFIFLWKRKVQLMIPYRNLTQFLIRIYCTKRLPDLKTFKIIWARRCTLHHRKTLDFYLTRNAVLTY